MDIQESVNAKEPSPDKAPGRSILDRLELDHPWVHQAEEEQVEATLNRYAQAARDHFQSSAPKLPDSEETEEEREARSQQLKLQQKCQDIAALIMVDELEEEELDE